MVSTVALQLEAMSYFKHVMEVISSLDTADIQSQPTVPLSPHVYVPPTLRGEECYHVFISYSSTDYQWTHSLINQLESRSLQVCYHERDFTPGRTVLENMSECIQESQKVLLVLSPEFVRSRWCLLEANMSLFRDCLERKPIIPVLLDPGPSENAVLRQGCSVIVSFPTDGIFNLKNDLVLSTGVCHACVRYVQILNRMT
uniref:TIR domain-containing protein n=1 Tax=Amphiprion percula TaxID=161767 RepID=A0A3P8S8V7_AMPPE